MVWHSTGVGNYGIQHPPRHDLDELRSVCMYKYNISGISVFFFFGLLKINLVDWSRIPPITTTMIKIALVKRRKSVHLPTGKGSLLVRRLGR